MDTTLYIVTCVFNPHRYQTRVKLYKEFENYVNGSPNTKLFTVELAFHDRPFVATTPDDPFDLQLRTTSELWHKERLINLGIRKLPPDWNYVAWVDADITFARPDWAIETIQLLHHYPVIQMFSKAFDLGPNYDIINNHRGIVYAYQENLLRQTKKYDQFHPGFAWAARKDALNNVGGLIDMAILGSADRHMASALVGLKHHCPDNLSPGYIRHIRGWQDRADKYIKGNVGYMPGSIFHYWHGKKVDRRYHDRWQILIRHHYDPDTDLKEDVQGCYQFTDRCPQLEYDIRKYFKARNEDSIDLE
jgi:hypothetical protein